MKAKEFISNPWFIAIASICSIFSVIEGVIIYRLQWAKPSIVASMNSVATPVVKTGTASKLAISYEGKPITSDITAVQIAIWNAGKKAVRPEQILNPITISVEGKHRILEAQIQRSTREVCKPTLQTDLLSDGKLGINWRILEPKDGLLVQVIYEGPEKTPLTIQTVIEEQGKLIAQSQLVLRAQSPLLCQGFFR